MAVNSSTDVKRNKDKLQEAESLYKKIEALTLLIDRMGNGTANVDLVRIKDESGTSTTYTNLDIPNYGVDVTFKAYVITELTTKVAELQAEADDLITEVDSDIP
jgi:hypothetical protein